MKGLIIYQGKYGATDQYARWLAETLSMPLVGAESTTPALLTGYDLIILGSSVYVGKLVIANWLTENLSSLVNKKLFLFIVCGITANDKGEQQRVIDTNLDSKTAEVFFLPGRCFIPGLNWKDRLTLKMGEWLQKDPKKKAVMRLGFDNMDRKYLNHLVTAVLKEETVLAGTG
jgi:menaquinone-dependent protoporphyrinogen IX oxidase